MRIPILLTLLYLLGASMAHAQCPQGLLVNGDMTCPEPCSVPAGWTGAAGSPDINDEFGPVNTTSPLYQWVAPGPIASPNGGTWQNLCCGLEAVEQTVATTPGASYTLCFNFCAQGITVPSFPVLTYTDPACVEVFLNDTLYYTSPLDTTLFTWEDACTVFVATTDSTTIRFGTCAGDSYVALDGVCLTADLSTLIPALSRTPALLSPNPAADLCRVSCARRFDRVRVIDAIGHQHVLPARADGVDISRLAPGLYVLQCLNGSDVVSTPAMLMVER